MEGVLLAFSFALSSHEKKGHIKGKSGFSVAKHCTLKMGPKRVNERNNIRTSPLRASSFAATRSLNGGHQRITFIVYDQPNQQLTLTELFEDRITCQVGSGM
jgi:hypothetical protein